MWFNKRRITILCLNGTIPPYLFCKYDNNKTVLFNAKELAENKMFIQNIYKNESR
jgi:hypothetical protein